VLFRSQAIDHGGEHSHVISGGALHSAMCRGSSAPDVTSTDHDTAPHVEIAHFLNSFRYGQDDLRRNIFPRTEDLKRFAAYLKNNAFVSRDFRLHAAST